MRTSPCRGALWGVPLFLGVTLYDSPPTPPPRRVRGGLEGREDVSSLPDGPPIPGWQLREYRVQGSEDSQPGLAPKAHRGPWLKYLKHIPAKPKDKSLELEPDPEASGSHTLSYKAGMGPLPLLTAPAY